MLVLNQLQDVSRKASRRKRVGRGCGSKRGKTCGRGNKGDKARMGYKTRPGYEGGQMALYRKLPCRGFTNARFKSAVFAIHFDRISAHFEDGEMVSLETLAQKGLLPSNKERLFLKILGTGTLTKKLSFEAHDYSKSVLKQLEASKLDYKKLQK